MYLFEVYDINALLVYNFLSQFRVILNRHYFLSLLQLNILRVMSQNEKKEISQVIFSAQKSCCTLSSS